MNTLKFIFFFYIHVPLDIYFESLNDFAIRTTLKSRKEMKHSHTQDFSHCIVIIDGLSLNFFFIVFCVFFVIEIKPLSMVLDALLKAK